VQADAREAAPGQHRGQAVRPFVGQRPRDPADLPGDAPVAEA
jgi:hypothetical protein